MRVVPGADRLAIVGLDRAPAALPPYADPARGASVLVTPGECTLLVPWERAEDARRDFAGAHVEGPFRMLTIDVALPWDVVGFFARVAAALAAEGIVIAAFSSFSRDHVLVRDADAERARAVLEALAWPPR